MSNQLLGTIPDPETKIPDSETNKSPLRKLEIPDSETQTPDSETNSHRFRYYTETTLLEAMGDGGGAWGGVGGEGGGVGGVISCIPNQAVIVYESGFLVSESGFQFPNQGFQFPNQGLIRIRVFGFRIGELLVSESLVFSF